MQRATSKSKWMQEVFVNWPLFSGIITLLFRSVPTERTKVDHMTILPIWPYMTQCAPADWKSSTDQRPCTIPPSKPPVLTLWHHGLVPFGKDAFEKNAWYMDSPQAVQFEGQLSVQGKKLCSMENLWRHENYLERFLAKGQRRKGKRESDRTVRSMGGRLDPALFQGTSRPWRWLLL